MRPIYWRESVRLNELRLPAVNFSLQAGRQGPASAPGAANDGQEVGLVRPQLRLRVNGQRNMLLLLRACMLLRCCLLLLTLLLAVHS